MASKLLALNGREEEYSEALEESIEKILKKEELNLDPLQREAVSLAAKSGILVITGGPGTGKTTTIKAILHFFTERGKNIALAAPTGRAAKRMGEATDYPAKTLHRLLEYMGKGEEEDEESFERYFQRNEENPLKRMCSL